MSAESVSRMTSSATGRRRPSSPRGAFLQGHARRERTGAEACRGRTARLDLGSSELRRVRSLVPRQKRIHTECRYTRRPVRALELEPALLIGGSAGSRVSLLTAIRNPGVAERLFLFWISGGAIGLAVLAYHYCHESVGRGCDGRNGRRRGAAGLEGAACAKCLEPRKTARGRRKTFIQTMKTWSRSIRSGCGLPGPRYDRGAIGTLKMPTLILRSGESDFHHPRVTSEAVHSLIPGSHIAEPPWGDRRMAGPPASTSCGRRPVRALAVARAADPRIRARLRLGASRP